MSNSPGRPTIEEDGWTLVSAEEQQAAYPDSFHIPARDERLSLSPGDGVKLLFDIETKEDGLIVDRGVDRMWVIIKARTETGYEGVLDCNPGSAENLKLREGDIIYFEPQHIAAIDKLPREYILEKYGLSFFDK